MYYIYLYATYRFVVAPDFLALGSERLNLPLRDAELIDGDLELTLYLIVVSLELGQSHGLLLDGLLQIDVGLVGNVQGHFQLSDLDLQLLLDASDFGPQLGLGFNNTSVQLFNFNAGLFAVTQIDKYSISFDKF